MYTLLLTLCISFISSSLHSMQLDAKMQHAAALQADGDGNVPMPQAPADASGKEAKADMEVDAIEQQPLTAALHIPMPTPEKLTLDKEEPIALAPFKELIEAQAKEGDAFVLAHVELKTCDAHGKRHINNYEAHSLLQSFGLSYPFPAITEQLRRLENAHGKSLLDPHKAPIHDITFYTYDSKQPEKDFVFLCSWSQLFAMDKNTSSALQLHLYANQNHDKKLKYAAIRDLGARYFDIKNFDKAREYYMRLTDQSIELAYSAEALYRLGDIHLAMHHYSAACEFYTRAANQSINPTLQSPACTMLALIYSSMSIDYAKAHEFAERATNQSINLAAPATAMFILAALYSHGRGVDKDDAKAVEYLTRARQLNHPETNATIDNLLKKILAAQHEAGVGGTKRAEHPEPETGSEPSAKKPRLEPKENKQS